MNPAKILDRSPFIVITFAQRLRKGELHDEEDERDDAHDDAHVPHVHALLCLLRWAFCITDDHTRMVRPDP